MTGPFEPVVEVKVTPRDPADQERLLSTLAALASGDPFLRIAADPATGGATVKGLGEAHLDIALESLRRMHGIEFHVGAPQVAFRETMTRRVVVDYTHKTWTGGARQFARVKLSVEPNVPGEGFEFSSTVIGSAVPKEYHASVEAGIASVIGAGVVAGFPVVDVKAKLVDGACHESDSSVLAFEIASRAAFREALQRGGSALLEPIMTVEVGTLEEFAGSVIRDLIARRGQIRGEEARGDIAIIRALVPMINLFGYASQLREITRGRGSFNTLPAGYQMLAPDLDPDDRPPMAAALRA
jgi:elongation factor G